MPMGKPPKEEFDVHALIEAQRRLMDSKHPFEQVVCTLWVAGTLNSRSISKVSSIRAAFGLIR